ncbi:SdiA-regulated domain-containing protein [Patescibacteria group bacterium]|nr:SdiA-regulated domain-containing protein [Patescibacteria group bacterium]MBU4511973.1 SdiA-regulated domain-containing protein [Patescibacteria group bacterium]MCG2693377.1 SdiA-regulated domain-containing protein [Candidatus Parcubacteria bacterium]
MLKQLTKSKRVLILIIIFAVLFLSYFGYTKIYQKRNILTLPSTLHEISGISYFDKNIIICEQDELGDIFFYDLKKKEIINRINVASPGDLEDITLANNDFYLLRSDGLLYELTNYPSKPTTTLYNLDLGANNSEGLTFDRKINSLLISTKSNVGNTKTEKKSNKDERWIYAFDLATKKLKENPFLIVNVNDIISFMQNSSRDIATNNKGKIKIHFRPSGLEVNPESGNIYILSSIDNLLAIFDRQGKVLSIEQLDPDIFNQPEGITFDSNGDLLISNEGGKGEPSLVRLKPKEF